MLKTNAFISSLLAQASPDGSSDIAINTIWDFVMKGGPMMIPIFICSLFALGVFIERISSLNKSALIPKDFLNGLHDIMRSPTRDRSAALSYCGDSKSPLGPILAAGIKRLDSTPELMEKHVQDAGDRSLITLQKNVRVLTVIASICPLLGLLGTIFGMIEAFQTVAISGEALGKTELLAEGIYEAMITTAAGLLVAIPVLIAYHYLTARIDGIVAEMDRITVDFLDEHAYQVAPNTRSRIQDSMAPSAVVTAVTTGGNGRTKAATTATVDRQAGD